MICYHIWQPADFPLTQLFLRWDGTWNLVMSGGQLLGLLSTYGAQEPSLWLSPEDCYWTEMSLFSCPFYLCSKTVVKLTSRSRTTCPNFTDRTGISAETAAWNRLNLRSHTEINDKHAYQTSHFLPDLRFPKQCCWQFRFPGIWHFVIRLVVFCILKDCSAVIFRVKPSKNSCHRGQEMCAFYRYGCCSSRQLERVTSQ